MTIQSAEGPVLLMLLAPPGTEWEIQYAEQLATPIAWQGLTTVTAGAEAVVVQDDVPISGQRFYRAVLSVGAGE